MKKGMLVLLLLALNKLELIFVCLIKTGGDLKISPPPE